MYKLINDNITGKPLNIVERFDDNAFIPFDPDNMDFVEYQKWLSEGNVPIPADKPSA